jgi:hypothetical protein
MFKVNMGNMDAMLSIVNTSHLVKSSVQAVFSHRVSVHWIRENPRALEFYRHNLLVIGRLKYICLVARRYNILAYKICGEIF